MRNKSGRCNHKKFQFSSIFSSPQRGEDETNWFLLEAVVTKEGNPGVRPANPDNVSCKAWIIRVLAIGCLCVSVPLIARWAHSEIFYQNDEFVLNSLEYQSDGMLTEKNLAQIANVAIGANLMKIDLKAIRNRFEKLAVVKEAVITREMPDKLRIAVKERTPVAWLSCPPLGLRPGDLERSYLIDAEGILFRCLDRNDLVDSLPIIETFRMDKPKEGDTFSVDGAKSALRLIALGERLQEHENMNIHSIRLRTEWSIECHYRSGLQVTFARHEVERGIENLKAILSRSNDFGAPLASVNVAARENIAVTFSQEPDPTTMRAIANPVRNQLAVPLDSKEKHLQSILKGG